MSLLRSSTLATVAILVLIALRLVVAAITPLSADEAYYWLWSKQLAAGYSDHPPMVAFIIRAGTTGFGDTSLGVRFVPWLLSAASTFAVWRAGAILLKNGDKGVWAALVFNVMPMVGIESLVATPDAPQLAGAAFLVLTLAELERTGRGAWWIAAGLAVGFGLLSKYSGFFQGAGIFVWLIAVPRQRAWFKSIWPYLGGAVALLMFAPVIWWNWQHDWISFRMQFGRVSAGYWAPRYLIEFLLGQFALASPFIAILGVGGLVAGLRKQGTRNDLALVAALIVPAMLYFLVHSLHDRVQGNWPSFLYPGFAIAVAAVCESAAASMRLNRFSKLAAIPIALMMTLAVYAQAVFGIVPGVRDPISRLLAVGIRPVMTDLETLRAQTGAKTVVTTSYGLTGWLSFYLPSHAPVVQLNERFRWPDQPITPRALKGPLLYVTELRNDSVTQLKTHFARVEMLAHIARYRNGAVLDEYAVYRLDGFNGQFLD